MTGIDETTTMRKAFTRLIPLLFVIQFFNYLDRGNIGFAALDMNGDLGFSPAVFGFAGSIFFFGYMLLGVPSNLMLHRVGVRKWIALIVLIWGVVATATAFVFNDKSLYTLRFLLGVMEAGFMPGVTVYLTRWFPERYRARAVSGYIVAGSFSAVLGGPVSTAMMTYANGLLGLRGWQWMFILQGLPVIVLGLLVLRYVAERPADVTWLSSSEKAWLESTLAAERAKLDTRVSLRSVVGDSRVWYLACMFGCALVGIYGLLLWLPQIIKSFGHLSNIQVGLLSAGPPLLGVLGTFVVGYTSDRTGDRRIHLAVVYAISALAIAGSAYASPVLAYVLLCVVGLFINAGNPLFWSLGASFRTGAAGAATIALINTIAQFGGLVGPWSIGLVRNATGSFHLALLTIAAFLVVSVIIALLMPLKAKEREAALAGGKVAARA
jgi:MFS family permease